jgi:hypothetical protein
MIRYYRPLADPQAPDPGEYGPWKYGPVEHPLNLAVCRRIQIEEDAPFEVWEFYFAPGDRLAPRGHCVVHHYDSDAHPDARNTWFEVTFEDAARRLLRLGRELPPEVLDQPDPRPPVICSKAALGRFCNRCSNDRHLFQRLLDEKRITKWKPAGSMGYDLRLMSWGDGSGVPSSGNRLVIVGTDIAGRLHIRIFDASGKQVTDKDETKLAATQAGAISALKQGLPDLLPPHVLTSAEKDQVLSEATSIVGQTRSKYHVWFTDYDEHKKALEEFRRRKRNSKRNVDET